MFDRALVYFEQVKSYVQSLFLPVYCQRCDTKIKSGEKVFVVNGGSYCNRHLDKHGINCVNNVTEGNQREHTPVTLLEAKDMRYDGKLIYSNGYERRMSLKPESSLEGIAQNQEIFSSKSPVREFSDQQ